MGMIVRMVRLAWAWRRGISGDQKATAGQDVIAMGNEPAFRLRAKLQRRDRRLHRRPEFRKGVEKRGDEHVAGPAAERIEMNIQRTLQCQKGILSHDT